MLTSLILSSIFVLHSTLVVSFPKLILPRQEACGGWFCPKFDVLPFVDDVSDAAWGVGAAGTAGAGWVIDKATGYLKRPPEEKKSPTTPTQSPDQIELMEIVPALEGSRQDQCTTTADSSPDSSSSQGSAIGKICEETTKQIIWAANCENTVQNIAFENTLKGMDPEVLTGIDQFCPRKGGILFWTGHLTAEQIELIKKEVNIVKAVEPDIELDTFITLDRKQQAENPASGSQDLPGKAIEPPRSSKRSNFFSKRDIVMKQQNADPSLSFLSTGKGKMNSGTYSYFVPSGRTVKLFYIGPGLDAAHPEFRNLRDGRIRWAYALDSDPRQGDSSRGYHGSCMASILAGETFGVARGLSALIAVKVGPHLSSMLDSFRTVAFHLETDWTPEEVKGYTVIYFPYGSRELNEGQNPITRLTMHSLMEYLINLYDAVLVVSIGQDSVASQQKVKDYPLIDTFPAVIATELPIIPVGAVRVNPGGADNGQRYPWSSGGPLLAVSAPGKGECLGGGATGTALATAYTAGLVAYLLSLRDVGEYLRAGMGDGVMPASVRQHLRETAFSRVEGPWPVFDEEKYTIWNGLDSETSNWMGPNAPPPDPPLLKNK